MNRPVALAVYLIVSAVVVMWLVGFIANTRNGPGMVLMIVLAVLGVLVGLPLLAHMASP
jgi:uncharacterized membrane protein YeaQ/YmgE (transglycosylase-associated protein family)